MNQKISDEPQEDEVPRKSGVGFLTLMIFFLVAAAAGSAIPFMLPNLFALEPGSKAGGSPESRNAISVNDMTYVSFGESTVNLDEGRMNRYLRLKMSLQVKQKDRERVQALLEKEKLVLRNWLLSHLSDKTLDEIRGKAGQNMLRREIRNQFNTTLFSDGHDRVYDILFEEFNVQ
ncbi:flagellar basal body-associated FliL family protein [Thalassoglobus polymorphus]|uniref:Flagellar protein FliL n=1 Tax=Thalassoglobus polymorphus TaxID=2527994 RepID=A0A517QPM3_9PLAN|nr:flagellar basal body-associated FliL family protein [Thalassoglobus polymorphus]QDT33579.1 flagellar basal body-associated protein FliL [Thalassoglobus polymorphus]